MKDAIKDILKDYKEILIAILIMGIISMTIVYANFTRRLQLVNFASINNTNWDIHFENLHQVPNTTNSAADVITPPSISEGKTIISGLDVEFHKPGDTISYTFDIVNAGDLDAKLYNYEKSTPICNPTSSVCESIIYTLKYTDGSNISNSDTLKINQRRNLTLTIKLADNATNLPNEKIKISNINAVFDYIQE